MKGDQASGTTVRDIHDQKAITACLGGGAWGEAVELMTPGLSAYHTLSPESAEDLAKALLELALEAQENRDRQAAKSKAFIDKLLKAGKKAAKKAAMSEPEGETECQRATRLRKGWEGTHPSLVQMVRSVKAAAAGRHSDAEPLGSRKPHVRPAMGSNSEDSPGERTGIAQEAAEEATEEAAERKDA